MERHISFCCDDNYLIPACIMLESLMKRNKGIRYVAHTFTDDLSEKSIKKFESLLTKSQKAEFDKMKQNTFKGKGHTSKKNKKKK